MPKSIPEKWLEYKPYGSVINGTKILPFKVPLKEAVSNKLEQENRFTTSILLEAFPHLKYVIDLTNTDRYYDGKEFTNSGVKYEKIMVRGREIPTMDVVRKFFKTMDNFISACGEEDLVGVHCTHGINRSGYLICRYLIQQLGWKVDDSLKAFEEARGYPIEREIYISALKRTPGTKIDTSKITISNPTSSEVVNKRVMRFRYSSRPPYTIGPPGFMPPRRDFAKDGPFSPPHFGYGGPPPGFRPPGLPSIPPPAGPPPLYGPRPFRYGPPPRPAMPPPPPRPGFPIPCFPPPCPSRTPGGGTRLPPPCPPARLPPPKMPPPPPPQPAPARPASLKRITNQKRKSHVRNGIVSLSRNPVSLIRRNSQTSRILPKLLKEQDFTVDTFEENLLAVSSQSHRRPSKGRFNQNK